MATRSKSVLAPPLILGLPLTLVALWGSGALYHRISPGTVAPAEATERVRVRVTTLASAKGVESAALSGSVRAEHTAVVGAKLLASVVATSAEEGDQVKVGAPLVTLDSRELDARAREALAGLQRAEASRATAVSALGVASAALDQARAQQALAETTHRRVALLQAEGGATDQALTEVEAQRAAARASVEAATQQREAAASALAEARAGASQASSALAAVETTRSYARVGAPFSGLVTHKYAEAGALSSPGAPLYELERGPYRLEVPIEAQRLRALRIGMALPVTLDGVNKNVTGRLTAIVPAFDPASRTAIAKVQLPDDPAIRSGMYGRADMPFDARERLWVPAAAIQRWYDLTTVYVVGADERVSLRLVRLGERAGERFEVLAGLGSGERVVVSERAGLQEGQAVEVTP